jgi:hypothetical protein
VDKLPQIDYERAPYVYAKLELGQNFAINSIQANILSEAITVNGVTFDNIQTKARYEDGQLSVSDTLIQRGTQWVQLGLDFDTLSKQYAVSLVGTAVPYEYNALLPSWWGSIFKDFTFKANTESLGDFIIQGNADQAVADLFFGHVRATNVSYSGVDIDEGTLFVRGRERYVEIDRMDMSNTSGKARGKIAFTSLQDSVDAPASIRYAITGNIGIEDAQSIFGGVVAEILSDFQMESAPKVQLEGVQFNDSYPEFAGKSYFKIRAETDQTFQYKQTQLEAIQLDLTSAGNRTALRNVAFQFADGSGQANADIITTLPEDPKLRFNLRLKNVDKDLALERLPTIKTEPSSTEAAEPARVDLTLSAGGPINAVDAFYGKGDFQMRSEELGSIQLFGQLSKILQNTRLGFTSFSLQTMDSKYTLKGNRVRFNELNINGPQTRIQRPS